MATKSRAHCQQVPEELMQDGAATAASSTSTTSTAEPLQGTDGAGFALEGAVGDRTDKANGPAMAELPQPVGVETLTKGRKKMRVGRLRSTRISGRNTRLMISGRILTAPRMKNHKNSCAR